jgi:glycosyltransferase involved in cell wall biosynthesis
LSFAKFLEEDRDIELALVEQRRDMGSDAEVDLNTNIRVTVRELRKEGRQHVHIEKLRRTDSHVPASTQVLAGFLVEGEDTPRVAQEDLSLLRQLEAARIAHNQLRADLVFQSSDMVTDRGLGEIHLARGFRETAGIADGNEGSYKVRVVQHQPIPSRSRATRVLGIYSHENAADVSTPAQPCVIVLVPDARGGIESLFAQLLHAKRSHWLSEIEYFTSHDKRPLWMLRFPFKLLRFAVGIRGRRFDICHVNLSISGSTLRKTLFSWVCRIFGLPYMIHLHGGRHHEFFDCLPPLARAIIRSHFKHAQRVIVLGTFWRDYVLTKLGVDSAKVTVLPNAVSGPGSPPTRDRSGPPHILFLGQLSQRKGVPELLEALASQELKPIAWTATLAGHGDVANYAATARALGLAERVTFPGWMERQNVQRLLETAHILVLPSHAENLPLSLLEGMAYGLCPVVTPVGAVPDVIRDGENGFLVPVGDVEALADRLARLVREPALGARLAAQARADFEKHYDISDYRRKLEAVYYDVLNKTRHSPVPAEFRDLKCRRA